MKDLEHKPTPTKELVEALKPDTKLDTWTRITYLRVLSSRIEDEDRDTVSLTPEEKGNVEGLLFHLYGQREEERRAELPCLTCCSRARDHIAVCMLEVKIHGTRDVFAEDDKYTEILAWVIKSRTDSSGLMPIRFCPFCSAPLPGFKLRHAPPQHLHVPVSDGDYCGHCGDRSRSCYCSFPESAWEPWYPAGCNPKKHQWVSDPRLVGPGRQICTKMGCVAQRDEPTEQH